MKGSSLLTVYEVGLILLNMYPDFVDNFFQTYLCIYQLYVCINCINSFALFFFSIASVPQRICMIKNVSIRVRKTNETCLCCMTYGIHIYILEHSGLAQNH